MKPTKTKKGESPELLKLLAEAAEDIEAGRVRPSRVTVVRRKPGGGYRHTEVDPEEFRRQQAAASTPVARVRHLRRMSQAAFADFLGVPLHTLQSWERGATKPSGAAATLLAVAEHRPEAIEVSQRLALAGTE